ncbi:MAG TPA: bifunctional DNA-formamidopyrimidine glycosylase/DNA-(apurinic or apyrimidinic site) lyase [Bacillaceae bacterium]
MPEGPEVQQVLNSLAPKVVDRSIVKATVLHPKITIPLKKAGRQDSELFCRRLEGAVVRKMERKGKYLIFQCEQADASKHYLVSHLGMTGAFFHVNHLGEIAANYAKHIHAVFKLDDASVIAYSDQRRFGWVGMLNEEEYTSYHPVQKVGPDPADEDASKVFLENIRKKGYANKPIKRIIMLPEVIQGVGNIYAAECLFRAKIHPSTPVEEIKDEKLLELLGHIKNTFELAIQMGGSSIRDYVNSEGIKGTFQELHQVYNKQHCPDCGNTLENVKIDNRSSYFCPECQKQ